MAVGRLRLLRRSLGSMRPPLEERGRRFASFQNFQRCFAEGAAYPAQQQAKGQGKKQGLVVRDWDVGEKKSQQKPMQNEWLTASRRVFPGFSF